MVTAARAGSPRTHDIGPATAAPTTPIATPHSRTAPAPWRAPDPLPQAFDTQRTILRHWAESDARELLESVSEDRASLLPWLSCFRSDYRTIGQCYYQIDRFRRTRIAPDAREYILGAFDRETNRVVGGTGFYQLDREAHSAEIGYWLRPSRRGEGLCQEMVRGLISWAFLPPSAGGWGLRRVEIFCAGLNAASRRIPETLGLRQEYCARAARWMDGIGWDDTIGWGLTADEWDCTRQSLRSKALAPAKPAEPRDN